MNNKTQNNDMEEIDIILGEISGYFMSQEGRCGDVVMPTEFLVEKSEKIKQIITTHGQKMYERGRNNVVNYIEAIAEEMGQDIADETVWKEVLHQARNLQARNK